MSTTTHSNIATIASIIKRDPHNWEVIDQEDNLHLIHYPQSGDCPKDGSIRGWVVDTDNGVVLAKSYGYTPVATLDQLTETEEGIVVTDEHHNTMVYPKGEYGLKIGHEGAMIRVFYTGGKVHIISHRRLTISRSRWGSSPVFQDMVAECTNKALMEGLFDLEKKESPYCHNFLLVHPDLLCCSLERVNDPYLLYLGNFQSYTRDNCPFSTDDVDWNLAQRDTVPEISLSEANLFLKNGYGEDRSMLQDPRLGAGEFVMIYKRNEDGQTDFIKVQSQAYSWRATIRDNNPNLKHRFYQLAELTSERNKDRYQELFPKLTEKQLQARRSLIGSLPIQIDSKPYRKLVNIWTCLWLSVTESKRSTVEDIQRNYLRSKKQLVEWLCTLERSTCDKEDLPERIRQILTLARFKAIQDHQTSQFVGPSLDARVRSNINNLIRKEYGVSLYRLVKAHERFAEEFH